MKQHLFTQPLCSPHSRILPTALVGQLSLRAPCASNDWACDLHTPHWESAARWRDQPMAGKWPSEDLAPGGLALQIFHAVTPSLPPQKPTPVTVPQVKSRSLLGHHLGQAATLSPGWTGRESMKPGTSQLWPLCRIDHNLVLEPC